MTPLLLAHAAIPFGSPMCWGIGLGAVGLAFRLAPQAAWQRLGLIAGLIGIALIGFALPPLGAALPQALFWLMAALAVLASGSAVTSRSPVYAAIWFAVSLLGTAGLFLLQGAQFLGIATIVVYAGAIVVTFLFVLMLAQPEGHSPYDRISWAGFAIPVSAIGVALVIGTLVGSFPEFAPVEPPVDILHDEHVARLGGELFARHLVSVEVVGTILLVALVGAIAIVIQGNPRRKPSAPGSEADQ
ncbi:MAG: NADH-quinone oxidoreductase subunit J [Planctomycetaceae bacterium]|nr:NADH-quinone oxidoreductase subunit J [Planctomycetales bacterium]MCB9920850.1 NADH-quinone oxidoreductase subunit J [Planctomycetaceae bacterium]